MDKDEVKVKFERDYSLKRTKDESSSILKSFIR